MADDGAGCGSCCGTTQSRPGAQGAVASGPLLRSRGHSQCVDAHQGVALDCYVAGLTSRCGSRSPPVALSLLLQPPAGTGGPATLGAAGNQQSVPRGGPVCLFHVPASSSECGRRLCAARACGERRWAPGCCAPTASTASSVRMRRRHSASAAAARRRRARVAAPAPPPRPSCLVQVTRMRHKLRLSACSPRLALTSTQMSGTGVEAQEEGGVGALRAACWQPHRHRRASSPARSIVGREARILRRRQHGKRGAASQRNPGASSQRRTTPANVCIPCCLPQQGLLQGGRLHAGGCALQSGDRDCIAVSSPRVPRVQLLLVAVTRRCWTTTHVCTERNHSLGLARERLGTATRGTERQITR